MQSNLAAPLTILIITIVTNTITITIIRLIISITNSTMHSNLAAPLTILKQVQPDTSPECVTWQDVCGLIIWLRNKSM